MSEQVRINGVAVFSYAEGGRLRVSADEWEQLGMVPSQRVLVSDLRQQLVGTDDHPPFVWLRFQPLSRWVG